MRIAVTGASGFVGPRLARRLAEAGHNGYAVSRREMQELPPGWSWLPRASGLGAKEFAAGKLPLPDCVVHLEVKQHVPSPTETDRAEFQRVNVDGTREWLAWCAKLGVRNFAYFSTIKAVGESERCQDETAASEPLTAYGRSKRAGEEAVRAWATEDNTRTALVLRPAVIHGPGNVANLYSMVRAIDRGLFFLVGENSNVKSLSSLGNVAAAVEFLLRTARPGCEVYNLVDPENHSVRELAALISEQLGKKIPPTIPVRLARWGAGCGDVVQRLTGVSVPLTSARLHALLETTHFSCEKLRKAGFVHPQTTEQGLAEMIRWYRGARADDR